MKNNEKGLRNLTVDDGDNALYTKHALSIAMLPRINICDPKEVAERSKLYFEMCIEADMKPTVAGYALALGVDRLVIPQIISGNKPVPVECFNMIQSCHRMLTAQMEDYMYNNKINPVAGIFMMRNNMSYTNDDTITIRAERVETMSAESLIAQAKALPIEMLDGTEDI